MTIYFYTTRGEYGAFSNFSRHGVEFGGLWYPTVEHYFQAMKFPDHPHAERIRKAPGPGRAKSLGQTRKIPLRADWEEVKDDIMREAVRKKFETHPELSELLLSTGEEKIIENAPSDYYWGCGQDGTGRNMLGRILMEVRRHLRAEDSG